MNRIRQMNHKRAFSRPQFRPLKSGKERESAFKFLFPTSSAEELTVMPYPLLEVLQLLAPWLLTPRPIRGSQGDQLDILDNDDAKSTTRTGHNLTHGHFKEAMIYRPIKGSLLRYNGQFVRKQLYLVSLWLDWHLSVLDKFVLNTPFGEHFSPYGYLTAVDSVYRRYL